MINARLPGTLIDTAWSNSTTTRRFGLLAAVVSGVCLLTLSAKLQVPFYPVPMTMQTLVVLMIGMACGRVLGTATVAAYLLAGAAGLPVFAGTPERGLGLAFRTGSRRRSSCRSRPWRPTAGRRGSSRRHCRCWEPNSPPGRPRACWRWRPSPLRARRAW